MDCRDKILSNDYYDVITDFPGIIKNNLYHLCYTEVDNLFDIIYLNRSALKNSNEYFYEYRSLPKLYGLTREGDFDRGSLIAGGITQIQREPLGLTGRGVVICFIDTGIDYTDPVFRNSDGSSRILAIWDQTDQTGAPPAGFQYGTEYGREEINRALRSEDPFLLVPERDEVGHGTALARAAAGSTDFCLRGNAERFPRTSAAGTASVREEKEMQGFPRVPAAGEGSPCLRGAAPAADIVAVKLKECKPYFRDFYLIPGDVPAYQENDIMLAVKYADSFAEVFKRPVVICLGLGTGYGDHAGSSVLSRYLNSIAVKRSRAVVVAGGNGGNAGHHYQGNLDNRGRGGGSSAPVEVRVDRDVSGFILELWGSLPDVFTVSVRSPGGETIPPVRLGVRESITYGFVYEKSKVTIAGTLVEPSSGEELIQLRVKDPTAGIWTFQVEAVGEIHNGEFHMWLPISDFLDAPVAFLEPSPYITLTEPAMAADVISVSAYDAANNSFYVDSGRGFSRTGAIRPDFAAPGVTAGNGGGSGSGLAAAITAGAVAQFMQWAVVQGNDPLVESREIKNYFIRGAARSFDAVYPNREWGYGRLNMEGTFNSLIGV